MLPIIANGHLSHLYSQGIIYIHFSGFHQMQSHYADWMDTAPSLYSENRAAWLLFIYLLIYYYYLALCLQLQICLHCSINLIAYPCFTLSPECPHRKYLCNTWRSCTLCLWLKPRLIFSMNTYPGFLHSQYIFSKSVHVHIHIRS